MKSIAVACLGCLAFACSSSSVASGTPSTRATQPHLLIWTNWVPDPKVTNGPEPGYKPAFTGLTGHDVQAASARISNTGVDWVVDITFTARGKDLLRTLTRANVAACADPNADCAPRHLPLWFDLTPTDVGRWEDSPYVSTASQPFDLSCLDRATASDVCPKLITDPTTLQEIAGGQLEIGGFSEQVAKGIVDAIHSELHS